MIASLCRLLYPLECPYMGKLRACIVSCNKEMSFDKCLLAQNLLILPCNSS